MKRLLNGRVYGEFNINGCVLTLREVEVDGKPRVQAEISDPYGRPPDAKNLLRLMDAARPLLMEIEEPDR